MKTTTNAETRSNLITIVEYVKRSREVAITPGNPYGDLVLEDMDITDEAFDEALQFLDNLLTEIT